MLNITLKTLGSFMSYPHKKNKIKLYIFFPKNLISLPLYPLLFYSYKFPNTLNSHRNQFNIKFNKK